MATSQRTTLTALKGAELCDRSPVRLQPARLGYITFLCMTGTGRREGPGKGAAAVFWREVRRFGVRLGFAVLPATAFFTADTGIG